VKILQRRFRDFSKNKIGLHKDSELENDLKEILVDFIPRKYGETPKILGDSYLHTLTIVKI
jgi:hypothetical protein